MDCCSLADCIDIEQNDIGAEYAEANKFEYNLWWV